MESGLDTFYLLVDSNSINSHCWIIVSVILHKISVYYAYISSWIHETYFSFDSSLYFNSFPNKNIVICMIKKKLYPALKKKKKRNLHIYGNYLHTIFDKRFTSIIYNSITKIIKYFYLENRKETQIDKATMVMCRNLISTFRRVRHLEL